MSTLLVLLVIAAPNLKQDDWLKKLVDADWGRRPWIELQRRSLDMSPEEVLIAGQRLTKLLHEKYKEKPFLTVWETDMVVGREYLASVLWSVKWYARTGWQTDKQPPPEAWGEE